MGKALSNQLRHEMAKCLGHVELKNAFQTLLKTMCRREKNKEHDLMDIDKGREP